MKQWRADRFPASWQCEIVFRQSGRMRVEVRNVSPSGIRVVTEAPVQLHEQVRLTAGGQRVQGVVSRLDTRFAGIAFDTDLSALQVASLRQFRRLGARRLG